MNKTIHNQNKKQTKEMYHISNKSIEYYKQLCKIFFRPQS